MSAVIVIDDDRDIAHLVELKLSRAGFDVVSRPDGRSGLDAILEQRPPVAIVDWMMPGMDGIELAKAVRSTPETRDMKLLMLTARSSEEDQRVARESGFDDIVSKPFRPSDLLSRVQALCAATGD